MENRTVCFIRALVLGFVIRTALTVITQTVKVDKDKNTRSHAADRGLQQLLQLFFARPPTRHCS